jgi:hypothetical protein
MRCVNPDFVSSDTKCKQRTPTTSKARILSVERKSRFFSYLDAMVRLFDAMQANCQAFQFDDDSEQFLATTQRLRKHLAQLTTTIKAEQREHVAHVGPGAPKRARAKSVCTSKRCTGSDPWLNDAPGLAAAAANYTSFEKRRLNVLAQCP